MSLKIFIKLRFCASRPRLDLTTIKQTPKPQNSPQENNLLPQENVLLLFYKYKNIIK